MTELMDHYSREHPQWTASDTFIDPNSFLGRVRTIYASAVLKAQLDQLKVSGCYDMFTGAWMPCYDVRRVSGAKALQNGLPPSLFWESDIGKWIESASYFLADPASKTTPYTQEFLEAIDKLVAEIEAFQQPDGYLNVYFTVVDPRGKFRNLRDMHEMYNAGHLLEGALAHYKLTGSRRFLDVMIKNVDCFTAAFGPNESQRPGYPGHPCFELALIRLHAITGDPRHLAFAEHLLTARGTSPAVLNDQRFFMWEAKQRDDEVYGCWMKSKDDLAYHQSHKPLHDQEVILGHSVRAMYLLTACADFGGEFLEDAKRLWNDATRKKMYITGGFGSEPQSEGFSKLDYYLPSSTGEGGCYAETCASIGAMMLTERILSHELHGKYHDVLELCLYNAVLGGGSLDGKGFSYANKLATHGNESALRSEWFEVCCCPPNLSRTLGMLPGYVWNTRVHESDIEIAVYLYTTATKRLLLTSGETIKISMVSEIPWTGSVQVNIEAPTPTTTVTIFLPIAEWMIEPTFSLPAKPYAPGYVQVILNSSTPQAMLSFDMEARLVRPHARVKQDTLSVMRGPIVFVAEDVDNSDLESAYPHFELVGLSDTAKFTTTRDIIAGIPILKLTTKDVFILIDTDMNKTIDGEEAHYHSHDDTALWQTVRSGVATRSWTQFPTPLTLVPWFARGNRGGKGHIRVPFIRIGPDNVNRTS